MRVDNQYFQEFVDKIEKKEIHPAIKKIFQLDEIVAAHQLMESNEGGGKIVVLT